jgi:hypothetical protein
MYPLVSRGGTKVAAEGQVRVEPRTNASRTWRLYPLPPNRYEAAFASLAPLPLALAKTYMWHISRPSYLWTSLWLFEFLLAERGIHEVHAHKDARP